MRTVTIVTDSTADIPPELAEQLGIVVVPLQVIFGNESYVDGVTMTPALFFEKLKASSTLPKTSQPTPAAYLEVYKRLIAEGQQVVSVHLSSAMSGTYQSALLAQSMLEQDEGAVAVVDSKSASLGYGMLALRAAELAQTGAGMEEVAALIKSIRRDMRLYFLVDTLEYLQKGGRIGKAAALFGTLLNIKPILSIDDEGSVFAVEKVRGQKRAFARIIDLLDADFGSQAIDLFVVDTPGNTDAADELSELLRSRFNVRNFHRSAIGSVIGTHAGPGTVGIFVTPIEGAAAR